MGQEGRVGSDGGPDRVGVAEENRDDSRVGRHGTGVEEKPQTNGEPVGPGVMFGQPLDGELAVDPGGHVGTVAEGGADLVYVVPVEGVQEALLG
jgi:hypothetical protein